MGKIGMKRDRMMGKIARKGDKKEKGTLILRQPVDRPYADYDIVNRNVWVKTD